MELVVADQRILLFGDQLTREEAKDRSWERKMDAFGTINKLGSFLNRPKDEDFELVYEEHRYQPFWHVVAKARYVYDRRVGYQIKTSGSEVTSVTIFKDNFVASRGMISLPVMEHCIQDEVDEVFVDGVTGKGVGELKKYLSLSPRQVKGKIEKMVEEKAIMIPPQARVSAIMRDSLAKMIKGIQADKIVEESVKVECVDLYYRPVYSFKYLWKSKKIEAIVEIDGLTGETTIGTRTFGEYLGKMLDQSFLFDLGADAAGMLIPGGSIAVKIAKKVIDSGK